MFASEGRLIGERVMVMTIIDRKIQWVAAGITLVLGAVILYPVTTNAGTRSASATLTDAEGDQIGTVRFTPGAGGDTRVRVSAGGLTAGFHGFHVHAVGECIAPFTSAGGHFNPAGATHGSHAGDMPPLLVGEDGSAEATFATDRFTVDDLMDADGSAVIVHAARDNLANIPTRYHSHTYDVFGPDTDTLATGDAGARAACGVVG
jgi:superoxide dismutase, Cu-Zn family